MAIIELTEITKSYGTFDALQGVNLSVSAGSVVCVLGDNGAGKSTLIKVLAGLHKPTSGEIFIDGESVSFSSPRDALAQGIATVYQDLAVVSDMSVWRNFFLGQELSTRFGALRSKEMKKITSEQLKNMGVDIPDVETPISSLSGGQRQVVAIARAIYFGARVIVLDEPTAALGVKQSGMVLKFIAAARDRGIGVVLITHNPHHAYLVGDQFTILNLGRQILDKPKQEITLAELTQMMAGGQELEMLSHELARS
ncbi:sugar ABC transporter ATP-binding protein [Corynebacterium sp. sy017]|nr:ATP-binding cassette domain-containing protein [Corynebacterium sp. sy017]MBP3088297.1 sugar ABC transporter ATP-binding protein [Corynebacterium sp. sy017]TSD91621.1 sugar ABC transporter ATP-binding protein [Corynebacterium sp. SY003]